MDLVWIILCKAFSAISAFLSMGAPCFAPCVFNSKALSSFSGFIACLNNSLTKVQREISDGYQSGA